MTTVDTVKLYYMGRDEGTVTPAGEDIVVILDFGPPWTNGTDYGTRLFVTHEYVTTAQIYDAVTWYLTGFYETSPDDAHLMLSIGTNNNPNFGGLTWEHGVAWAGLVHDVYVWITSDPSWADRLGVRGGTDVEPGFDPNGPSRTRAWVDGYASAYTDYLFYYDYGTCDSCPYSGCLNCIPPTPWVLDDIWYVSWGDDRPAFPLPEIYTTDKANADQWYRMSKYSDTYHSGSMYFLGSLTQWQACQTNGPCPGADNTPGEGYLQLHDALNADPVTAQDLRWSTDITWVNETPTPTASSTALAPVPRGTPTPED